MAYNIVETEPAAKDLENIIEYISYALANRVAASTFLDEVEKCYDQLSQMPMMYGFCKDTALRKMEYHKVTIKNYVKLCYGV